MAVDGSFPDLARLLNELEKPENKLAVLMLQLSAGDQTSDNVTASIPSRLSRSRLPPQSLTRTQPEDKMAKTL